MASEAWFRLRDAAAAEIAERVRSRIAERTALGLIGPDEVERVASARVRTVTAGGATSEAFRRCCIVWEVDRPAPVTSHRRIVGPLLVALKRIVRRMLRFQHETALARQREFNRNLLVLLSEILERTARREG